MQGAAETPVRSAIRRKPAAEPVYVNDDLTDWIGFELWRLVNLSNRLSLRAKQKSGARSKTMSSTGIHIDFNAAAALRKWPSLNNERVSAALGARPYLIVEGSLDECIRQFLLKPANQRHL